MNTTTRHLGTCPVCTAEQKLTPDSKMVHHGFRRPGHGSIVGDCFGVGYLAYQLSCEGTKAYLRLVQGDMQSNVERLHNLTTGQVKVLCKQVSEGFGSKRTTKVVEVQEGEGPEFGRLLQIAIANVESNIKHIGYEIERLNKLVTEWAPQAVRTVEEGEREAQAVKDGRKAVKDAEKAAKVQAKVAGYQKRIDSALKRKNAGSVADIFESITSNTFQAVAGGTREERLKLVDRNEVFEKFGLVDANGQTTGLKLWDIRSDTFVWPL
jgi:hypothetical protein